jgi:hypothetical protein
MPYTTNQLISGAYYAAGVVSREFETVNSSQIADGLQWLNEILGDKVVDQGMLPYETSYSFYAQTGVEKYFIPNLIQVDTLVFYLDQVRYAMTYQKRNKYFGSPRVENIQTLPNEWYVERVTGGANLYIYFLPDKNYAMQINGTFRLNNIQLGQDLLGESTTADLGTPIFYGQGQLAPSQLLINNFDLSGTYQNIGSLTNYINSGIISGVTANAQSGRLILSSESQPPTPIYVKTSGYGTNGAQYLGSAQAATTLPLAAIYNNGTNGVNATLTASAPSGPLVVDGYSVNLFERVIVKDQTIASQNGAYVLITQGTGLIPWVLVRSTNYDESLEIKENSFFTITNGVVNNGTAWVQNQVVSVVGTSPISFSSFNNLSFSNFSTIQLSDYKVYNANGFDQFYITYLRYALADRICSEYNYATPLNVKTQLLEYEEMIRKKSRLIDLRMEKNSTLQKRGQMGWAFINIGRGWTTY